MSILYIKAREAVQYLLLPFTAKVAVQSIFLLSYLPIFIPK
jgi:hypothetical protein